MLKRLANDAMVYGVGIVASRFAYILLLPLYLRWFSLADYGLLEILLTTGSILLLICDLQIVSGVLREYYEAREEGRVRGLLGSALIMYLINTSVWVAAGCFAFAHWSYRLGGTVHWIHVLPILIGVLPTQVMTLGLVILRLEVRKFTFITMSFLDLVTGSLLSIIFATKAGWGIAGILWGMAISKILWSSVLLWVLRHSFGFHLEFAMAKRILKYGVPMVPGALAQWAQSYSSRFLLVALLTLTDVGLFSLAARLTSLIALVDLSFRQAWEPHLMHLFGVQKAEPTIARVYKAYLFGMFTVCTIVAFLGPCTVSLFAGHRYAPSTPLFGFLAYASLWNGSSGILSSGNSWERKTHWNGLGVLIGVIINVGFVWFTARHLGLMGVGAAALISSLCAVAVIFGTAQRNHRIPYDIRRILLAGIGSVVLAMISYAINVSKWFHLLSGSQEIGLSAILACAALAIVVLPGVGIARIMKLGENSRTRTWLLKNVLSAVRR